MQKQCTQCEQQQKMNIVEPAFIYHAIFYDCNMATRKICAHEYTHISQTLKCNDLRSTLGWMDYSAKLSSSTTPEKNSNQKYLIWIKTKNMQRERKIHQNGNLHEITFSEFYGFHLDKMFTISKAKKGRENLIILIREAFNNIQLI